MHQVIDIRVVVGNFRRLERFCRRKLVYATGNHIIHFLTNWKHDLIGFVSRTEQWKNQFDSAVRELILLLSGCTCKRFDISVWWMELQFLFLAMSQWAVMTIKAQNVLLYSLFVGSVGVGV